MSNTFFCSLKRLMRARVRGRVSETFGEMISVVGSGVSSAWSGLASLCLEAVSSNGIVSVYESTTKIRKTILNMYKIFLNYFTAEKILKQERPYTLSTACDGLDSRISNHFDIGCIFIKSFKIWVIPSFDLLKDFCELE